MIVVICLIIISLVIVNYNQILKIIYPLHYKEIIFRYAEKYDLDPYLIASIIRVESKFDKEATSQRGAIGLMQIMPATGKWIAKEIDIDDFTTEKLYKPELNIKFGSWYLAHLKRIFDDDLTLVIAAYNGGQGNVNRWIELKKWTGKHKDSEQIPFPETRDYVQKTVKTYRRYQKIYQSQ